MPKSKNNSALTRKFSSKKAKDYIEEIAFGIDGQVLVFLSDKADTDRNGGYLEEFCLDFIVEDFVEGIFIFFATKHSSDEEFIEPSDHDILMSNLRTSIKKIYLVTNGQISNLINCT